MIVVQGGWAVATTSSSKRNSLKILNSAATTLPSIRRPNAVVCCRYSSSSSRMMSSGTGLAERVRLGRLADDGLSYKEKFVVRCYEVGINKTATLQTLANYLQVSFYLLL